RLTMALAHGVFGMLQATGAALSLQAGREYEAFPEGSFEREVLAIQRAANALIAREVKAG
ncbi:MAG: hypothetical protein WEC33_06270, partial [Dehalococcoidia bacterium]